MPHERHRLRGRVAGKRAAAQRAVMWASAARAQGNDATADEYEAQAARYYAEAAELQEQYQELYGAGD